MKRLFTSESVTQGHPDKICDQISDSILDAILEQDPFARVACETAITTGMVLIMGEITTTSYVDIPKIVRKKIKEIGYANSEYGFDAETCAILVNLDEQSNDIAFGVDNALESRTKASENYKLTGAGDQGMMIGFACDETEELMPLPISLAHKICMQLDQVRKEGILDYLRPDGKSQVTVEYQDDLPVRVDAVVVSAQHDKNISQKQIENDIINKVIYKIIPNHLLDHETKLLINPTGRFVTGGPRGDSGLTGRKIIVDTYGGYASHGGGAFSGKDPTKVDRSAAYAARYVAKNIVASGLAKKCEIQLAYAIGVSQPVSIFVNTYDTGLISDDNIIELIKENFDLSSSGIMESLELRQPIYSQTASYGHFGRSDICLPWEKIDKVDVLKKSYYNICKINIETIN